jgi:hypothetical protein
MRFFNSCVIPVLTYGCESWKCSSFFEKKLLRFENNCLRRITILYWSEFKSNDKLREETHFKNTSLMLLVKGVGPTSSSFCVKIIIEFTINLYYGLHQAKESTGRSRETLKRTVLREIKTKNIHNIQKLQHLALDRQNWETITSALCANFRTKGK